MLTVIASEPKDIVKVLAGSTGGAGPGALAGARQSTLDAVDNRRDRQWKSKRRCSHSMEWSKRVTGFINKAIAVLKALIALLELIRRFLNR